MIQPIRAKAEPVQSSPDMIVWRVSGFDVSLLNNACLVPTAGYSVGACQFADGTSTLLSTGVLTWSVCNDPSGNAIAAHPTTTTQSAAGTKAGVALESAYFGVRVTTAQASVMGDLWIVLRK